MRHSWITVPALLAAALLPLPAAAAAEDATTPAVAAATTPVPAPDAAPVPTPPTTPTPAPIATAATSAPAFALVGRSKIGRNGTITLTVMAPTAGKFIAFAEIPGLPGDSAVAGAARATNLLDDDAPMPLPYGDAATVVDAGKPAPLFFRPGKAGKAAIMRTRGAVPLRVTIAVMFGPVGGALTTNVYVVKLYRTATGAAASATRAATR